MWNKKGLADWLIRTRKGFDGGVGLTQDALAYRIGCKKAQISKIENQRVNPSLDFLVELCKKLGVSLTEPLEAMGHLKPQSAISKKEAHTLRFVHYYQTLLPEDQKLVEQIVMLIWRERGIKEADEKTAKRRTS